MGKSLVFIGHKPESLPFSENELDARCIQLKAMLLTEITDRAAAGYDIFICGAERGADIIFGRQVLLVKLTTYPNIKLVCAIPHEGQTKGWSEEWIDRYTAMLEQADETVVISKAYTEDCRHKRDQCMVDAADTVLAVYNGGGQDETAYTVGYARQHNKETVIINPITLKRIVIHAQIDAFIDFRYNQD